MSCYPEGTDWSCLPDTVVLEDMDAGLRAWAEEMAWNTISALTAHQIALCPVVARPCIRRSGGSRFASGLVGGSPFSPLQVNGNWINAWCGSCAGTCGHPLADLRLPGPVGGIVQVMLDGVELDPSSYRVDDGALLVRQDGEVWPSSQNLSLPDTEIGTWSVTYYRGWMPDTLVKRAAGTLAYEFVKSCTKGAACRLPNGVTSISRQGVSMEIQGDMFENGLTGIREVDTVIRIYNPNALKVAPVVYSPDSRRVRLTSSTGNLPGGGYGSGGYGE